jgi:hypothetical protein
MYVGTVFLACMDSRLRGNDAEFAIRRQVLARTFAPVTIEGFKFLFRRASLSGNRFTLFRTHSSGATPPLFKLSRYLQVRLLSCLSAIAKQLYPMGEG